MERNAIHYTPRYFSCGMYFRFLPKPTRILSKFPSILELDSFPCPAREPWELGALAGRPDLFSRKKNFSINHDSPGRSVFLNIIHDRDKFSAKTVESATGLFHFQNDQHDQPVLALGKHLACQQPLLFGGSEARRAPLALTALAWLPQNGQITRRIVSILSCNRT